jgi:hypothetical protein
MWDPGLEAEPVVGLARIPVARQKRNFDCGPTCLKMICGLLEFHPKLPAEVIGDAMGTNPTTGTTEVEMARGLDFLGLSWRRPTAAGTDDLRRAIAEGNAVLLRTLMPGGFKHWVVAHGWCGDEFMVTCPGRGRAAWGDRFTREVWAARGFDHFAVPTERDAHPAAAWERAAAAEAWRPVHAMGLREFTEGRPVVADAQQTAWHARMIREAADGVRGLGGAADRRRIPYEEVAGYSFYAVRRHGSTDDMVVVEDATGAVAGGIWHGLRWVAPPFRGRGLGAEIALAAHCEPGARYLAPSSYSEAGMGSRVAAWRTAVQRALRDGLFVPAPVRAEYEEIAAGARPRAADLRDSPDDGPQLRLF